MIIFVSRAVFDTPEDAQTFAAAINSRFGQRVRFTREGGAIVFSGELPLPRVDFDRIVDQTELVPTELGLVKGE